MLLYVNTEELYQYLVWDSDSIEDQEDHVTANIFAAVDRDREGIGAPSGASRARGKETEKKKDTKKKKNQKKKNTKKKSKKKSTSDSSSTSSQSDDSSSSSSDPWC